jgi:hypothetical protein
MWFLEVKMNKKMKKKRKDLNKKKRRKKNNLTKNSQIMIQKLEEKAQFILVMKNLTTEKRTKFIQVLKYIIHQEEDPMFNSVD